MHNFSIGQEVMLETSISSLSIWMLFGTVEAIHLPNITVLIRDSEKLPEVIKDRFSINKTGHMTFPEKFFRKVPTPKRHTETSDLPPDTVQTWADAFRLKPNWIDPVKESSPRNTMNDWALDYIRGHHNEQTMKAEIEGLTKKGLAVIEIKIKGWRNYEITHKPAVNFSEFSAEITKTIACGLGLQIYDVQPSIPAGTLRGKSVFESAGISGRQCGKTARMESIVADLEKQGHEVLRVKHFAGGTLYISGKPGFGGSASWRKARELITGELNEKPPSTVNDPASINKAWKKPMVTSWDEPPSLAQKLGTDYHRNFLKSLENSPSFLNQQYGLYRTEFFDPSLFEVVDLSGDVLIRRDAAMNELESALDALMNGGVQKGNKGDTVRKVDRRKLHNVRKAYQNLKRVK